MDRVFVIEVDAILLFYNLQDLIVGIMLENELLNQEECFLMLCVLPDLDSRSPCVRGEFLLTGVALHPGLHKLHYKCLLHISCLIDVLRYC